MRFAIHSSNKQYHILSLFSQQWGLTTLLMHKRFKISIFVNMKLTRGNKLKILIGALTAKKVRIKKNCPPEPPKIWEGAKHVINTNVKIEFPMARTCAHLLCNITACMFM